MKIFDKIQHLFLMRKVIPEDKTDIDFLNYIQNMYLSPKAPYLSTSTKIRNRQECPISPLLISFVLEVLANANRQEESTGSIRIMLKNN